MTIREMNAEEIDAVLTKMEKEFEPAREPNRLADFLGFVGLALWIAALIAWGEGIPR